MTPSSPLVSVIMAVHNGERYLDEAIESVLSQTFQDFQFIIIDDGSNDSTGAILDRYRRQDARVSVLTGSHQGHVASLNRGCAEASGKYLARMDADDVALPDRFERQVRFLEKEPMVAVLGGATYFTNSAGHVFHTQYVPTRHAQIVRAMHSGNCIVHSTVMMRRKAFDLVRGYRAAFEDSEDYDLWLRMADNYRLSNLPEPVGCYRQTVGQVSHRDLRRQLMASLAAQAAAVSRERSGVDQFGEIDQITPSILCEHGITDQMFEEHYVLALLRRSCLMLHAEGPESARVLLNEAIRSVTPGCSKSLLAATLKIRAQIELKQRQGWRALRTCVGAARLEPLLIARAARRVCNHLTSTVRMRPGIRSRNGWLG